jgi:hypothetical protein
MITAHRLIENFERVTFKVVNFKYKSNTGGEAVGKTSKTKSLKRRCIIFLCFAGFFGKTVVSTKYLLC